MNGNAARKQTSESVLVDLGGVFVIADGKARCGLLQPLY